MKIVIIFLAFIFFACASGQYQDSSTTGISSFYVTIANKTRFDISVFPDTHIIPGGTDKKIQLPIQGNQLSEGYRLTCYVNIAGDVIKAIPLENKIIKKEDKVISVDDIKFINDESFFVISNISNSVIKVRRTNSETFKSGLGPGTKREGARIELHPGKTYVYLADVFSCSIQNEQGKLFAVPPNSGGAGSVNYFVFDGSGVTLTDARPLRSVGESAWVTMMKEALGAMPLAVTDDTIHLFAATGQGLIRYAFDSAGTVKEEVKNGNSFVISSAARAGNGFLVAGYEKQANRDTMPVARIHATDGVMQRMLKPSEEFRTARFFTAAQKDDSNWLLAGDGAKNGISHGNTAYAMMVRDKDGELAVVWELGGDNFDNGSGKRCGDIKSAAYNHARDCWLVTGEAMENGVVFGSYIAEINDNGIIQKIDNSFNGMTFYKILADTNGVCFFAGEEHRGGETYAVLIKYNADDGNFRRLSVRPPSHSYYHDAILDKTASRIILAGVLHAKAETGRGGIPFIEAVDSEKGTLLWQERYTESSEPSFRGTSLITAIAPMLNYGFALALSGMSDSYEKPFVVARVNSQGKFLREPR